MYKMEPEEPEDEDLTVPEVGMVNKDCIAEPTMATSKPMASIINITRAYFEDGILWNFMVHLQLIVY